jgi:hypothetical protein
MGQFKPMVKMYTTEPSVELKLKKGGHVKTSKMKVKEHDGHKMMDGGVPPAMPARGGLPTAAAPMKPSLAMRRKAMRAMPSAAAPAGPVGMAGRMMKKGGSCEEMIQEHANKPASKAHKGLKKGGDCYATGGVAMGQGGFKKGGKVKMAEGGVPKSGIINTEGQGGKYRTTKMDTAEYTGKTSGKTGEVKNGNGGGYKKGGRCYADGGKVMNYVDGNVVGTPAGKTNTTTGGVKMSNAGGFKKGGKAKKMADGGPTDRERELATELMGPGYMSDEERRHFEDLMKGRNLPGPSMKEDFMKGLAPRKLPGGPMKGGVTEFERQIIRKASPSRKEVIGYKKGGSSKKAADGGMKGKPAVKGHAQKYADGGMVQGAPMGLPSVSPMGRVGLPPVSASGRIYDPYNSMLAQQPGGQPTPVGYATGGSVQDDGRAVKMPKPRVPTPVSINQLSGTYKKGGRVK